MHVTISIRTDETKLWEKSNHFVFVVDWSISALHRSTTSLQGKKTLFILYFTNEHIAAQMYDQWVEKFILT